MAKLTTDEFIRKAKIVHGDKYIYDQTVYINNKTKVKIYCKEHGYFEQCASSHVNAECGCPKCGLERGSNKLLKNTEYFIEKAKLIHGDRYDYSLVEYKNAKENVIIKCKIHGKFEQTPSNHHKGYGCPECGRLSIGEKLSSNSTTFIEKAKLIHGDKYDYSFVKYETAIIKVGIFCNTHKEIFYQTPNKHLRGRGCPKCKADKNRININVLLERFYKVHGDKYDYSLVEYTTGRQKIKIKCPIHDIFEQTARNHMRGCGCPSCNESQGEKQISLILNEINIKYVRQKKFKDCKDKGQLPFDFYLPNNNVCIEFDGSQHYNKVSYWCKTDEDFSDLVRHDNIKTQYCLDKNITLIRIRYDENIENKLNEYGFGLPRVC